MDTKENEKAPVAKTVTKKTTPVTKKTVITEDNLSIIEKMIKEISETEDKIEIDGRKYTTVAKRNEILRKYLGFGVKVITEPLKVENDAVVFACKISIKDNDKWVKVATGHSEENRASSEINKLAAFENAETSAIGRALANLGLTGGEFATVNEVKSKSGIEIGSDLLAHIKELIKFSGISEKNLFASYNIRSLDKSKPETLFKIMNECLKSINQKKKSTQSNAGNTEVKEEEIKL